MNDDQRRYPHAITIVSYCKLGLFSLTVILSHIVCIPVLTTYFERSFQLQENGLT